MRRTRSGRRANAVVRERAAQLQENDENDDDHPLPFSEKIVRAVGMATGVVVVAKTVVASHYAMRGAALDAADMAALEADAVNAAIIAADEAEESTRVVIGALTSAAGRAATFVRRMVGAAGPVRRRRRLFRRRLFRRRLFWRRFFRR
jgi:hypothetical protein